MNTLRPILSLQHTLNPLHVYCRLLDTGLSRGFSAQLCTYYEILVFRWIVRLTRLSTAFFFLIKERNLSRPIT